MENQNQNIVVEGGITSIKDYLTGYREGYKNGFHDALAQAKVVKQSASRAKAGSRHPHRDAAKYAKEIREALEKNKKLDFKQMYSIVGGTPVNLQKQLNALVDNRVVRKEGLGKRGSPFIYELYPEARNFNIITRKTDGTVVTTTRSNLNMTHGFPSTVSESCKPDALNYATKVPLMDAAKFR